MYIHVYTCSIHFRISKQPEKYYWIPTPPPARSKKVVSSFYLVVDHSSIVHVPPTVTCIAHWRSSFLCSEVPGGKSWLRESLSSSLSTSLHVECDTTSWNISPCSVRWQCSILWWAVHVRIARQFINGFYKTVLNIEDWSLTKMSWRSADKYKTSKTIQSTK